MYKINYWCRLKGKKIALGANLSKATGLKCRHQQTVWPPNEQCKRDSHDSDDKYPAQQNKMAKRKISPDWPYG